MHPQTEFGSIAARSALVGNHITGGTNSFIFHGSEGVSEPKQHHAYHVIPFPPNEELVIRPDLVSEVKRLLPATSSYQSAALSGLGGSGKTQLALAYAYDRCHDPTCSVFWIHADSETSFTQDCQTIAQELGLAADRKGKDLLHAVRRRIETTPNWVLILDNADNLQLFGVGHTGQQPDAAEMNLADFVPRASNGTILWTSRDERIGSLVGASRVIRVAQMTYEEAKALLENGRALNTSTEESQALRTLFNALGYLPLAITQAAAYMRRTLATIDDYLSKLQQKRKARWKLLRNSEYDRHRRRGTSNSIIDTWNISIDHLRQESELTYYILHVLAYVDNQHIPFKLIQEAARQRKGLDTGTHRRNSSTASQRDSDSEWSIDGESGGQSSDSDNEDDGLEEAIARLREFSFLHARASNKERQERVFEMHQLVQEAAMHRLQDQVATGAGSESYFAKTAFQVIDALFPHSQQNTWPECEEYLLHAQKSGNWADLHEGGADIAMLLDRVSLYLYDRGRWREREPVDKMKLRFRKRILQKKHPDTMSSMADLAATYYEQGKYDEDEKISVELLKLRKEVLGDRHPDTISSMASLATTYHAQRRSKEAEMIYIEVLKLRKEVLGDRHPDTIRSIAEFAVTYFRQRKYNEAEAIFMEALELQKKVLGDRHPDTIWSMVSLAATYYEQGRYDEDEKISVEVLKLRKEVLGDRHPDTMQSMAYLAVTYYKQERYKEAETMEVEVLELRKEVLGDRHPDTIRSMADLVKTYHMQGKYDEAERIKVAMFSRDHTNTIDTMTKLTKSLTIGE